MKKIIFLLFVIPLFANGQIQNKKKSINHKKLQVSCQNQKCPGSRSINFSTGINPLTGDILPIGNIDPSWQLLNYPPLNGTNTYPVNIPNAYVINEYQPNWNDISGVGILSSITSSSFADNNKYTSQPWRFKRNFCVCKKTKTRISGVIRADDRGTLYLFDSNGNELFSQSTVTNGAFNVDTPFNGVVDLPIGIYHFEFHLLNTGGKATGFSIKGQISTLDNSSVLLDNKTECCKNNGFISVQKILESKNCNGKIDVGESPGAGWVFNLKDSNGQIIQSKTTNSNGELIFYALPAGTYTVSEENISGWSPNLPSEGSKQITITENNGINIIFFNCPENPKTCCPGTNLIKNGDFEQGNQFINSEFLFTGTIAQASVVPGKYSVINGAQAAVISPTWASIQDPSTCNFNSGKFLAINGQNGAGPLARGGEPVPEKKVIWEQTVKIDKWKHYKFCFKAKNLSQLGFDIKPRIDVKFVGTNVGDILNREINLGTGAGPCNWTDVSKGFNLWGQGNGTLKIQIILDQTRHGDGNDIAIDDIGLIQLKQCPNGSSDFNITTTSQANHFNVKTTSSPSSSCPHNTWTVCEIDPQTMKCLPNTELYAPHTSWIPLSINFPGYVGTNNIGNTSNPGKFEFGKFYKITRGIYGDCKGWTASSMIVYKLPGSNNRINKYTEKQFKAKKTQILKEYKKASLKTKSIRKRN